jgi:hypothetical protein
VREQKELILEHDDEGDVKACYLMMLKMGKSENKKQSESP